MADSVIGSTHGGTIEATEIHECEDCERNELELKLFFCNICECLYCDECWSNVVPHRKKKQGQGAKLHEKIDPRLAQRIKAVLSNPSNDEEFEQLHAADQTTAWFGKCGNNIHSMKSH
jgi:hypothetical protein